MDAARSDGDDFAHSLRAEWDRFRAVRGWGIGMVLAGMLTALPGLILATGSSCEGPRGAACPAVPAGPNGEAVTDKLFFVHQPLAGDGSITVRVTSLTGLITYPPPAHDKIVPGVMPWAKAGVIIKTSVTQGSAYAATMITGGHGVRMQYNFTEDMAGAPGAVSAGSPRWLRLTRTGETLTGYESTDGTQWTKVGTARLAGLPATAQAGFFVTSPCDLTVAEGACRFTNATATFDHVSLVGAAPDGAWGRDDLGAEAGLPKYLYGAVKDSAGAFSVTGSGDMTRAGADSGLPIAQLMIGAILGLIAVMVVAAGFGAAPLRGRRPGRVLLARALVIGGVSWLAGAIAAIVAMPLGSRILLSHGNPLLPVTWLGAARIILGTGMLLGTGAVLALLLRASLMRTIDRARRPA